MNAGCNVDESGRVRFYGVCEDAQAGDGNFDAIAGGERRDAGGSSGEDEVARLKRECGGDVG